VSRLLRRGRRLLPTGLAWRAVRVWQWLPRLWVPLLRCAGGRYHGQAAAVAPASVAIATSAATTLAAASVAITPTATCRLAFYCIADSDGAIATP